MKLIVTDLDNTLLRSENSISEYTVSVFERCRGKGILTAFASARAEHAMLRFIEAIKPDMIISNGGATVRANGEIIYRNALSGENVYNIVELCKHFTGGNGLITAECDDGYYCNFVPNDPDRRAASAYSDFADFRKPSYKITAELENEEWAQRIAESCDCSMTNFSGEIWRRFAAKYSDKKTALKKLTEHLGIKMNDVIAFGDDQNDLEMLKMAGTAVAVDNAIAEVKAVADYVTGSNDEDGVARFIEQYILSKH